MKIKELMEHPILSKLAPAELKAYLILKTKAKKNMIENFSIKGTLREWQENKEKYNMPTSKNTVKDLVRSLEESKVISYDKINRKLILLI